MIRHIVADALSLLVAAGLAIPAFAEPATSPTPTATGQSDIGTTGQIGQSLHGTAVQTGIFTGVLTVLPGHMIAVTVGHDAWEMVTVSTTAAMAHGRHVALEALNGRTVTVRWVDTSDMRVAALIEAT
jgi:hypothetical protein